VPETTEPDAEPGTVRPQPGKPQPGKPQPGKAKTGTTGKAKTGKSTRVNSAAPEIAALAFSGTWRHYQELALEAFEHDRRHGQRSTYIVAPPGSGKTLLGVEIVRRLGARALVLVPNTAVQEQWMRAVGKFGAPPGVAAADPAAPIACLTYQALCQLDDPGAALADAARRRWAQDRAKATGSTPAEAERDALAWTGEAAARRGRELARITAGLKREIAKAGAGRLRLRELLSDGARQRIAALRASGVRTVVLDECHHLASLWGYIVREAVAELGDVHLAALTATPPDVLTSTENDLYGDLLGPVDFTVPTPALVRERTLAPFQELAWLTRPLDSETQWLAEHDLRFTELITTLHEEQEGVTSLPSWVIGRLTDRTRGHEAEGEEAAESWAGFQRRHPALARAGARFLVSGGLDLPPGVPRGEGYREPPDLADWLVLLEDYALHCLAADSSGAAGDRYAGVAAGLRALGFTLTRQGIRRGASDVDRLLMNSGAKSAALADVVAGEFDVRGERLRALVLTDTELASAPGPSLVGVLRPEAGSAPEAVRALAADPRTAALRPLLVSGRGLRCAEQDAGVLLAALTKAGAPRLAGLAAQPASDGLVQLAAPGSAWQPRLWVELATSIFTAGATRLLVGTRALLGEGWDAPCVNCLVDLSSAATAMSVVQSRGRALRLDPGDPEKIASNWDIVCVAPELARGTADYGRFVRKHGHLFAPSEDGVIEAGPSHVHPTLGPFAPPPAGAFDAINREIADRAAAHQQARERWGIGQPYTGVEQQTLVVLPRQPARREVAAAEEPPHYLLKQNGPLHVAAYAGGITVLATLISQQPAVLAGLVSVPAALGWAALRLGHTQHLLGDALPLDLVAHAICDAYHDLHELSGQAAASLAIEPRASGYLRCYLREATSEENQRFTSALDGALCPAEFPRYLISRLVPAEGGGRLSTALRPLGRVLRREPPFGRRWVAVPDDFGRTRKRAEAFAAAWRRWLGPAELQFALRSPAGRDTVAAVNAERCDDYQTSTRRIWV
jgi:superfamily II DNA or RNA helicase